MMRRLVFAIAIATVSIPTTTVAQVPQEIEEYCRTLWGSDYEMRLYCQKKQMVAKAELDSQEVEPRHSPKPDGYEYALRCEFKVETLDDIYKCDPMLRAADNDMTIAYKRLRSEAKSKSGKAEVLKQQREWLARRDSACNIADWEKSEKSDGHNKGIATCLLYETVRRASALAGERPS